jgi:hypothetical protein
MKNLNENKYFIEIRAQHSHIAKDLVIHWQEKGYEVTEFIHDSDDGVTKSSRIRAVQLKW